MGEPVSEREEEGGREGACIDIWDMPFFSVCLLSFTSPTIDQLSRGEREV